LSGRGKGKFSPKGIEIAYPNRNFVRTAIVNRGGSQADVYEEMYGWGMGVANSMPGTDSANAGRRTPSGYGHSIGQRAGKLRLSGNSKAHRIGKR
jgi:hypothetical protein